MASDLSSHPAFQPWQHGSLRLRNRIVMAPMTRRRAAPGGRASNATLAYYGRRAAHEVGLIISEGTHIDGVHAPDTFNVPRFHNSVQREAWARIVDTVHAEGSAFAPQLWHTGRRAVHAVGPVDETLEGGKTIRAMTVTEIEDTVTRFAECAAAAKAMGCDTVELHGAHGYLLDSFLDPEVNTREDAYGGDEAGRRRFMEETVRAVRTAVGPDYPIILRLSQWRMDGYTALKFPDSKTLQRNLELLRAAGVDLFHLSTRHATDAAFPEEDPTRTLASWARQATDAPVIAVGGVTVNLPMDQTWSGGAAVKDPQPELDLVAQGETDLLAVGRSLIANPDWVQKVRAGRWSDLQAYDHALLAQLR